MILLQYEIATLNGKGSLIIFWVSVDKIISGQISIEGD